MVCDLVASIPPFPIHSVFSEETVSLNEDESEGEAMFGKHLQWLGYLTLS